ncbi:CPBP family intramembrane metalloprotease, partial [Mycolicibacterium vaccae]|nr:CPBP family intramembrane metalloprotease [Mycolicibacterium vaccae]
TRLLLRIPLGTVCAEEAAYRGALAAAANAAFGRTGGRLLQATAFGLSHIADARATGEPVLPTVLVTGLAGWVLGWLGERSGSVLAPILAHLAINETGAAAALALQRPLTISELLQDNAVRARSAGADVVGCFDEHREVAFRAQCNSPQLVAEASSRCACARSRASSARAFIVLDQAGQHPDLVERKSELSAPSDQCQSPCIVLAVAALVAHPGWRGQKDRCPRSSGWSARRRSVCKFADFHARHIFSSMRLNLK